jgi:4-hydroxybenzoate polyprenyltransferase
MNTASLKIPSLWGYLQLMRPANIVTAWADILAGFAASGSVVALNSAIAGQATLATLEPLPWLLLATTGLYGGGIVFNDVFDAQLDAKERPERPIPSGRASPQGATLLGSLLLLVGVLAAAQVSLFSALIAAIVASAALFYDAWGKHNPLSGPLNMGLCRGGNLLLGLSAVPALVVERWFLALIPIFYIAAVTTIGQGEVHGGKSRTGVLALLMLGIVLGGISALGILPDYSLIDALPFLALLAGRVLPPFIQSTRNPNPELIQTAVKTGIISLILLNAIAAAGFAGWFYGLLVLLLLPISIGLARLFAVT